MTYSEKLKDPRWQKKRLEIFSRDEFCCQWCCADESTLHVHHLKYNGDPWEADSKDLITICEDCHNDEHNLRPALEKKLLTAFKVVRSGALPKIIKAFENCRDFIAWEPTPDILEYFLSDLAFCETMKDHYFEYLHKKMELKKKKESKPSKTKNNG